MRNARSNTDGNSARIVLRQLDLAGMHADAHWNVEPMQLIANGAGAVNRARRSVEGGQETVAQGLHLLAAEPRKLLAHRFVMSVEKVAPCPMALGVGAPCRVDDVREHDGGEHTVDDRRRSRTC